MSRRKQADPDAQLKELWRTIRGNAKMFRAVVARLAPDDADAIRILWKTLRKGMKRNRLRRD